MNKIKEISNRPTKIPVKIYLAVLIFGSLVLTFMFFGSNLALSIIESKERVITELNKVKEEITEAYSLINFDLNHSSSAQRPVSKNKVAGLYDNAGEKLNGLITDKVFSSGVFIPENKDSVIAKVKNLMALLQEIKGEAKTLADQKRTGEDIQKSAKNIEVKQKNLNAGLKKLSFFSKAYFAAQSKRFVVFRRVIILLFSLMILTLLFLVYVFNKHRKEDYITLSKQYDKLEEAYREIEETKEDLRHEEERYKLLVMGAPVGIHELNIEGKFISMNNYETEQFKSVMKNIEDSEFAAIVAPSDRERISALFDEALNGKENYFEFIGISQNDESRYFRSCFIPQKETDGSVIKVIGITLETTKERLAVRREKQLQRLYDILSEINHVVVRENISEELYDKVCEIFIEKASFKLAWIGKVANDKITPVSFAGTDYDYLRKLEIDFSDGKNPNDNVVKAVKNKKIVVLNNITNSDLSNSWLHYSKEHKFNSSASVPILIGEKVVAVLTVISEMKNYFEQTEAKLIEKIGEDISFAISKYEIENERNREAQAIDEIDSAVSSTFGKSFFDTVNKELIRILDAEVSFVGKLVNDNKTMEVVSGFNMEESLGGRTFELEDSLCENVIKQNKIQRFDGINPVPSSFLDNDRIKSYVGVPLHNSRKKAIGVYALFFSREIEDFKIIQTLLLLFSSRIGIELERDDMLNKLLESDNRFKSLLNNSPLAISMFGPDGTLLMANPKWEKMWGLNLKRDLDRFNILKSKETKKLGLLEKFKKVYAGGEFDLKELEIVDRHNTDRKRYYSPSVYTSLNREGKVEYLMILLDDITQRKFAESKMNSAEHKYRMLYEMSNDAFYLLYDNKFEMVNKKFTEMFGYTLEETNSDDFSFTKLLAPESLEIIKERVSKIKRGEEVSPIYEFTAVAKNGERINCEASVTYIDYKDGQATQGIIRDITERTKLLESLRNSAKSYEGLFENTVDAIYIQEADGKFITVNKGAEKMYGYKKEEFAGKYPNFLSPEGMNDMNAVVEITQKAFAGEPQKFFFWGKKKNGEIFPKEVRMFKGEYFGNAVLITFGQDITERIEKEKKIKASEERYRTLFQSSSDAILLMRNEEFVDCNDRTLEMFECRRDQIIGVNPIDFSPVLQPDGESSAEAFKEKIDACLKGEPQLFEWKQTHLDGSEFESEVSLTKLDMPEGVYVLVIVRDITQRKIAEREVLLAREKADKANSLKSEFLAQVSHEVRTPLSHFNNYFSLLRDDLKDSLPEELNFIFDSLEISSRRITRTIESMILSAELSTGIYEFKSKAVDLGKEIINPLIKEFVPEAMRKNIELKKHSDTPEVKVNYDEQALKWIIKNLLENAVKYTKEGKVEISYAAVGDKLSVSVADTGIGINEDYLKRLYAEPFSQVDSGYTRKFDGNGLGLWMTKAFCDLGGAAINVKTTVGKGTTFTVDFPIAK
ncbi:MAG: PAS domain S-box protein [Chlorobi bacterium]|nr:PAS domain S-box protein [Chlorobiota bacterium]